MEHSRTTSLVWWNLTFLVLFLAFMAGIYFDVTIQMKSLAVTSFGLIFFPILFVLVNMKILNRKHPFAGKLGSTMPAGSDRERLDRKAG